MTTETGKSTGTRTPQRRRGRSESSPLPVQQILVTTDFSPASKLAFPHAAGLARQFGAEVAVLSVVEPQSRFAGLESVVLPLGDARVGEVYAELETLVRDSFTGVRVKTLLRNGKPYREIARAVRELRPSLLVMGTHGHSGLKHVLMGSTTERVVRQSRCPVLVVRSGAEPASGADGFELKRMAVGTDLSRNAARAFPMAKTLAAAFDASVSMIHVVERFPIDAVSGDDAAAQAFQRARVQVEPELRKLCEDFSAGTRIKTEAVVRFGIPHDELTRAALENDASLIVVATHGYSGWKHLYLGSVAERVVRHAHCPVLVVPARK